MVVLAIRWVGVATDRYAEMRSFALDMLGLTLESEDDDFLETTADDIGARDELAATRAVELGDLQVMEDGYAWQHFRAPDGSVYELTFDPSAL
jgi:hypothetical protein